MTELAQRAVACRHWRWMPGILTDHGRICGAGYLVSDDVDELEQPFVDCTDTVDDWSGLLPDLADPATLGCLIALVREAWGDPLICVAVDNTSAGWWVDGWTAARPQVPSDLHPTEAAALVAALEAAP